MADFIRNSKVLKVVTDAFLNKQIDEETASTAFCELLRWDDLMKHREVVLTRIKLIQAAAKNLGIELRGLDEPVNKKEPDE